MTHDELEASAWMTEVPVPNWKFVLVCMATFSMDGFYEGGIEFLSEHTGLDETCVTNALIGLQSRKLISPCAKGVLDGFHLNITQYIPKTLKVSQIDS